MHASTLNVGTAQDPTAFVSYKNRNQKLEAGDGLCSAPDVLHMYSISRGADGPHRRDTQTKTAAWTNYAHSVCVCRNVFPEGSDGRTDGSLMCSDLCLILSSVCSKVKVTIHALALCDLHRKGCFLLFHRHCVQQTKRTCIKGLDRTCLFMW